MSDWLNIIEATAAAIQRTQRLGANSPSGKRLVARAERRVRGYFGKIRASFPLDKAMLLYGMLAPQVRESVSIREVVVEDEFALIFREWLEGEDALLRFVLMESMADGSQNGFEGSFREWLDAFGIDAPEGTEFDAMIPQSVIDDTRERAARLVKDIDEETIKQIANTIADGLDERLTVAEMTKAVKAKLADMTDARAKLIAQTEMNRAIEDGKKAANVAVGADEKEWIQTFAAKEPRAVHTANMTQGRIPIGRPFDGDGSMDAGGGNLNPYNCHCTVNYYGASEEAIRKLLGIAA